MKRALGIVAGALLGLCVMTPQAFAVFAVGELNEVFYTNRESLFTPVGAPPGTGVFKPTILGPAIGDFLVGVLRVQGIDGVISLPTFAEDPIPPVIDQITGIFAQEIIGIVAHASPSLPFFLHPHLTLGNPTITTFFDPATGLPVVLPLAPGEMFAFFHDMGLGTPGTDIGTMAANVASHTDGLPFMTFGLDATAGLGGDGLFGTGDDTGHAYTHLTSPTIGTSFGQVDIVSNSTGLLFAPIASSDAAEEMALLRGFPTLNHLPYSSSFAPNPCFGAGSPTCPGGGSVWELRSNDPGELLPLSAIPEASSLWMFGMGLSGLGIFRRRKLLA